MPVAYEMGRGTGRRKVIFIFFFWKKKRRRFIYSDFAVNLRGNTHQRSIRTTFRFFLFPPPYFIICFYYIRLLFPPLLSPFAPSYVYGQARELWLSRRISYIYIYIYASYLRYFPAGGWRRRDTYRDNGRALPTPVRIRPRPVVYDGHLRTAFRGRANPVFIYFFREIRTRPFVLRAVGSPGEETRQ